MKKPFGLDSSPRTKAISRPFFVTLTCIVMIVICVVWGAAGNHQYNKIMSHSSTPVGSTIEFSQSEAELELSGLYTDKNESALVARLTPTEQAHETLPYKGTDYAVLVQSDALDDYEEIPILFGKMSTDGDMFLILPQPTKEIYSFALVNKRNMTSQAVTLDDGESGINDDASGSIAKSLSEYTNEIDSGQGDDAITAGDTGASDDYDLAALRMTTHPAYDDDAFKPEQLDVNLLDPKSHKFNFEDFYKKVYVDAAVNSLTKRYNELEAAVAQNESLVDENESRLRSNPDDSAAESRLSDSRKAVKEAREKQQETADRLTY